MNPIKLTVCEIIHRWKSSLLVALTVAAITGLLTFFSVNNAALQKEIGRGARDIGSNVVILPADVDQFDYYNNGGYSNVTMSSALIDQLIEYKASLNHLIPMLERKSDCVHGDRSARARIVGISASIPIPGRPKSPMQKSIPEGEIQLGSQLAEKLRVNRDGKSQVTINGRSFGVSRVNRANGTWQDTAAFLDLKTAQTLFDLPNEISRIEAIECTSEQCEQTGLKSDVILTNELARITDQATLLRREKIADARSGIRGISQDNSRLLQNALWTLLALSIVCLASLNSFQRKSELGVLQAVGYGQTRVVAIFVLRSVVLAISGAVIGIAIGAFVSVSQSSSLFTATGKTVSFDWTAAITIGLVATALAAFSSCLPALFAASRSPAELIGREA